MQQQTNELDTAALEIASQPQVSMVRLFLAFLGDIIAAIGLIVTTITVWQLVINAPNPFLKFLIGVLACGPWLAILAFCTAKVLQYFGMRGREKRVLSYVDVLIENKRDENKRANEAHAVDLHLKQTRLAADERGNRDYIYDPMSMRVIPVESGNFIQPVPHSIHYSIKNDAPAVLQAPGQDTNLLAGPARDLPKIEMFYDLIKYNSLQTGMGIEATTGNPVITPIRKAVHFKLVGGSGLGKSCLAAGILDIATSTNDPDHLKIGLLDLEHNTSRLFENLPHIAEIGPRRQRLVGRDADEVAQKLKLLQWELTRRANLGEEHCTLHEPVLLVYVEEMLALKYEVVDEKLKKEMLAAINILGVRARKYGIFLLACMQIDYSDKSTREAMAQFRTRAGFAVDPEAARASGFFNTELVKQNFLAGRSGQYVLEKPQYSNIVLAHDYDVATRLEQLSSASRTASQPAKISLITRIQEEPEAVDEAMPEASDHSALRTAPKATSGAFSAQEQRIIQKFLQEGMTAGQIVSSEWTNAKGEPLTSGDKFMQRSKEVQDVIRRYLAAKEVS